MRIGYRFFLPVFIALVLSAASTRAGTEVNGPIKVSPGGRYFVDRHDKPFFWLGDTSWPLFTRYSPTQAEEYLKRRSAQGFTVIHTALIWPTRGASTPGARPNPEGQLP